MKRLRGVSFPSFYDYISRSSFASKAFLIGKTRVPKDFLDSHQQYYKKVPLLNPRNLRNDSIVVARELSLWERIFGSEDGSSEKAQSQGEKLYKTAKKNLYRRPSRMRKNIPFVAPVDAISKSANTAPSVPKVNSSDINQFQSPEKESLNTNLSDVPIDEFWEQQNQQFQEKVKQSSSKEKVWKDDEDPFIGKASSYREPAAYSDQLDDRQYEGSRLVRTSKSRFGDIFSGRRSQQEDSSHAAESKDSYRFENVDSLPSTDQVWEANQNFFQQKIQKQTNSDPPSWTDESKDPWRADKTFISPFSSDTLPSSNRQEDNPTEKRGFDRFTSSSRAKDVGVAVAVAALVVGLVYMLTPHVKRWLDLRRNSRNVYRLTGDSIDVDNIPRHLRIYRLVPVSRREAETLPDRDIVIIPNEQQTRQK